MEQVRVSLFVCLFSPSSGKKCICYNCWQEEIDSGEDKIPKVPRLQLSSANIDRHGVYIMDQLDNMYLMVGGAVSDTFCKDVFGVPNFAAIPDAMVSCSCIV